MQERRTPASLEPILQYAGYPPMYRVGDRAIQCVDVADIFCPRLVGRVQRAVERIFPEARLLAAGVGHGGVGYGEATGIRHGTNLGV